MSDRRESLRTKMAVKEYCDSYVRAHTRGFLAAQIRHMRGDLSQEAFATKLGKSKTVIGRLENPNYRGWSLKTMLEIAASLNIAVIVRFVDQEKFIELTDDFSDRAQNPLGATPGAER